MNETEMKSDSVKNGNKSVKKDIIIVAAVIVIGAALILRHTVSLKKLILLFAAWVAGTGLLSHRVRSA